MSYTRIQNCSLTAAGLADVWDRTQLNIQDIEGYDCCLVASSMTCHLVGPPCALELPAEPSPSAFSICTPLIGVQAFLMQGSTTSTVSTTLHMTDVILDAQWT